MRENRPYGSEGGGAELNRLSLPLSLADHFFPRIGCIARRQVLADQEGDLGFKPS